MRHYEIILLIHPDQSEQVPAMLERYKALVTAAEGKVHNSAGLAISGNDASIALGVNRSTIFVADWSGDRLMLGANRLGRGLSPFEKR